MILSLLTGVLLHQAENQTEKEVAARIKRDFPPECQPEVFAIYERLEARNLEGACMTILKDARGDIYQVRRLAAIVEKIGIEKFFEYHE